jgi:hypothetical protein
MRDESIDYMFDLLGRSGMTVFDKALEDRPQTKSEIRDEIEKELNVERNVLGICEGSLARENENLLWDLECEEAGRTYPNQKSSTLKIRDIQLTEIFRHRNIPAHGQHRTSRVRPARSALIFINFFLAMD